MLPPQLVAASSAVVAQVGTDVSVDVGPGLGLVGSAVGAFLTTLVVGVILIAVVPDYTERMTTTVLDDPVGSFLYGIVVLVLAVLVTFLLAITLVGLIVAVPLAIVAYLIWAVGATVAYLAIADRLVGHDDGWLKPLVVGAGLSGVLALTGVGAIIAFGVGAVGFGAVLTEWQG